MVFTRCLDYTEPKEAEVPVRAFSSLLGHVLICQKSSDFLVIRARVRNGVGDDTKYHIM